MGEIGRHGTERQQVHGLAERQRIATAHRLQPGCLAGRRRAGPAVLVAEQQHEGVFGVASVQGLQDGVRQGTAVGA